MTLEAELLVRLDQLVRDVCCAPVDVHEIQNLVDRHGNIWFLCSARLLLALERGNETDVPVSFANRVLVNKMKPRRVATHPAPGPPGMKHTLLGIRSSPAYASF